MAQKDQLIDTIRRAINETMAELHTATIARVTSVGDTTISCQPVISRLVRGQKIDLPEFVDVPPVFMQGGESYLAHPISEGDYCLLLVMERCFDRWYNGQDNQTPLELRMHDYSDGFALVGVNPMAAALTIPQETTMTGVTRMGVEDPSDMMALAGLVLSELQDIKADFDALKTWLSGHTHSSGGSGTPTSSPPTAHTPGSVASAFVKAD
jgi:hypothetical protein